MFADDARFCAACGRLFLRIRDYFALPSWLAEERNCPERGGLPAKPAPCLAMICCAEALRATTTIRALTPAIVPCHRPLQAHPSIRSATDI